MKPKHSFEETIFFWSTNQIFVLWMVQVRDRGLNGKLVEWGEHTLKLHAALNCQSARLIKHARIVRIRWQRRWTTLFLTSREFERTLNLRVFESWVVAGSNERILLIFSLPQKTDLSLRSWERERERDNVRSKVYIQGRRFELYQWRWERRNEISTRESRSLHKETRGLQPCLHREDPYRALQRLCHMHRLLHSAGVSKGAHLLTSFLFANQQTLRSGYRRTFEGKEGSRWSGGGSKRNRLSLLLCE